LQFLYNLQTFEAPEEPEITWTERALITRH